MTVSPTALGESANATVLKAVEFTGVENQVNSRRRGCHFAGTPFPSISKRLREQNDSLADG